MAFGDSAALAIPAKASEIRSVTPSPPSKNCCKIVTHAAQSSSRQLLLPARWAVIVGLILPAIRVGNQPHSSDAARQNVSEKYRKIDLSRAFVIGMCGNKIRIACRRHGEKSDNAPVVCRIGRQEMEKVEASHPPHSRQVFAQGFLTRLKIQSNPGVLSMSFTRSVAAAALLSLGALMPAGQASAADLAPLPMKAKPIIDVPFFLVNDNRLSYSYIFSGTDPGVFSVRPDGSINGKTAKQVYSFTHFDVWAYGTNFFTISAFKSDHNDPVSGCPAAQFGNCAGATEIYGLVRSTFGFNEIFGTKAFSYGPLRNISFEIGGDVNTENNNVAPAKRDIVAGLQFAFDLPYKGFFNVAPMYYKEINHNSFLQCGTVFNSGIPGQTCLTDGNTDFKGTWVVEVNYYMDLGFLPDAINYFSLSGRAGIIGKKGYSNAPLSTGAQSAIEYNTEPVRLTFDASKAVFGPKYSHNVDVWVAYRYWKNKFGLDADANAACRLAGGTGISNNSCTESSLYSGVTVKF